ncbi:MAG: helicase C-terminal domain-containing protein, partial [Phycisphaeraceae bacterium]|nr:helicase C-terminal domain-containing protein [Phycisphaeraceae bacterium]
NTISLQEQLIDKDIPLLQSVLGCEFSAVLVKGRNNYLSVRRLTLASQRQERLFSDPAELRSLHAIEDWAYQTDDGSLSSLPVIERMGVWDKVQSDSGNCMGRKCPTYQRCFYQAARRRMDNGDLLVVNHALFFADLAMRASGVSLLPPYDHVILDEAHTIEDIASVYFGIGLSEGAVAHLLGSLHHGRRMKGFLTSVVLNDEADLSALHQAVEQVHQVRSAADAFFGSLAEHVDRNSLANGRIDRPRVVDNPLSDALKQLAVALRRVMGQVKQEQDRFELNGYLERAETYAAQVSGWLDQTVEQAVYWVEVRGGRQRRVSLSCAPVDVGPILRNQLFEGFGPAGEPRGVVLTSATLATAEKTDDSEERRLVEDPFEEEDTKTDDPFGHLIGRLGCDSARTLQLGSPFDHEEAVQLIVEAQMPDPRSSDHPEAVAQKVLEHVRETEGGAFVLFTSYRLLNDVADRLRRPFREAGWPLMVQGQDGPRSILLQRFRATGNGVLMGTDSFWAGVDVPGEALRNVIITKLPFAVPDRPLTEARLGRIRERGGD